MTQRLHKLAEYLQDQNYEQAITYHELNAGREDLTPQDMLLLAKAYYLGQSYQKCMTILNKIDSSIDLTLEFETTLLKYKASYLMGTPPDVKLRKLADKLKKIGETELHYIVDSIAEVVESNKLMTSSIDPSLLHQQKKSFEALFNQENQNAQIMEGMPVFLVASSWFQNWQAFVTTNKLEKSQKKYPGPVTQFQILDHTYHVFCDKQSNKFYTNQYIYSTAKYMLLPKKCWEFLKNLYGGIEVRRYNISSINKPFEVIAEVHLKKILIHLNHKHSNSSLPCSQPYAVQITKKETWKGLRLKLEKQWSSGNIFEIQGNGKRAVFENQILEDADTTGKRYLFVVNSGEVNQLQVSTFKKESIIKIVKCGNSQCTNTSKLKWCQCKSIRYCSLDCLKVDWGQHKKKCESEMAHLKQQAAVFKNFALDEKEYGGRKGLVGLKNLGNTCYMNSGLQCLSNTKQITEYFMKDHFKTHINYSNHLGTKGNLACAYAELIREIWTGSDSVISPFKLKKIMGNFASQFSGFGQQDSQEFISYLIDGLQQDLNLVKKKETFESSDEVKSDEEASKESEINYSKRIQSYIRNLMAGQFKSTVVCSKCNKVSVCFDPYLLISLPIPLPSEGSLYFIPFNLAKGAIKMSFDYKVSVTTLDDLRFAVIKSLTEKKDRQAQTFQPEKNSKLLFVHLHEDTFNIEAVLKNSDILSAVLSKYFLFCYEIPELPQDQELVLLEGFSKKERICFPRLTKIPKRCTAAMKQEIVLSFLTRKEKSSWSYEDLIDSESERVEEHPKLEIKMICVSVKKNLKLLTYTEQRDKILEEQDGKMTLHDCLKAFSNKEKLEKDNSWYCNQCKEFREAVKQMEIYKSNEILVLAFKRFSRNRKIRHLVNYPISNFDLGPHLLSNREQTPLLYDLYGVVNHYGSLGGGHYTAYCQNFLNKRWYEFNDSRVSEISTKEIVTGDSYVLFYRRKD